MRCRPGPFSPSSCRSRWTQRSPKPTPKSRPGLRSIYWCTVRSWFRRNTKIIGHVTEAKAHSKTSPGSLLGISFERMLLERRTRSACCKPAVQAIARPLQLNNLGNETDRATCPPGKPSQRARLGCRSHRPLHPAEVSRPLPFPNRPDSLCPILPPSARSLPPAAESSE